MSCWMPSSSQEAWFPQLRTNRLKKETEAATALAQEQEQQRKARAKRKLETAPALTE